MFDRPLPSRSVIASGSPFHSALWSAHRRARAHLFEVGTASCLSQCAVASVDPDTGLTRTQSPVAPTRHGQPPRSLASQPRERHFDLRPAAQRSHHQRRPPDPLPGSLTPSAPHDTEQIRPAFSIVLQPKSTPPDQAQRTVRDRYRAFPGQSVYDLVQTLKETGGSMPGHIASNHRSAAHLRRARIRNAEHTS